MPKGPSEVTLDLFPLKGEVPLLASRKAVSELKASLESFKGDRFEWEEPTALRPVAATKSRYNSNHEAPLFNGEGSLGHRNCFQYHLIASNGRLFLFDLRSKMTWSKAREKEILEKEVPGEHAKFGTRIRSSSRERDRR